MLNSVGWPLQISKYKEWAQPCPYFVILFEFLPGSKHNFLKCGHRVQHQDSCICFINTYSRQKEVPQCLPQKTNAHGLKLLLPPQTFQQKMAFFLLVGVASQQLCPGSNCDLTRTVKENEAPPLWLQDTCLYYTQSQSISEPEKHMPTIPPTTAPNVWKVFGISRLCFVLISLGITF